ncbi:MULTISPECIES: hypothetical protein [unclassified Trichocoleus]|uniref:hypothetical protein n=1 Tax=unclassified Trichocoleus TaxID=2628910 RepID=UPI001683AC8F|nr:MULTISPECIES: hypothetical protein [unclassified Trichocoleus]
MPLVILTVLMLTASWIFSQILVLWPLSILNLVSIPNWLILTTLVLLFVWCFGE